MEAQLTPWLEDTVEGDLLLGNNWLHTKLELTKQRGSLKGIWAGVYEDDGSSLEIFDVDPSRSNTVQIIQASPLRISDGKHWISAALTTDCEKDVARGCSDLLFSHDTLPTLVSVRKYSLICTTYGPPADKLLFLIHALDRQPGSPSGAVGIPTNILSSTQIATRLDYLHITRSLGDQKFEQEETEGECTMSRSREMDLRGEHPLLDDCLLEPTEDSQIGFGTQFDHPPGMSAIGGAHAGGGSPVRENVPPPSDNPLEPGTSRNIETAPKDNAPENAKQEQLLSLLNRSRPPAAPRQAPPIKRYRGGRPGALEYHHDLAAASRNRLRNLDHMEIERVPSLPGRLRRGPPPVISTSSSGFREAGSDFLASVSHLKVSPSKVSPTAPEPQKEPDVYGLGADWMQGLQYDANSAQVPRNQQSLLNTTNSWAKPQPGYKYYDGNVPIEVYKETAAIAGQSETIDGEPETTVAEDAACTKAKLNDEDTDEDDSATYWPSSPIPESPHIQPPLRQGLPPDSSFESLKNSPQKKFAARPVATAPSPSGNTAEDVPSSPPDGNAYINSDDEMDMEVPRGLGEESPKKLKDRTIPTRAAKASGSDMSRSQSMVQVKETPHAKEKNQGLRPGGSSATLPNQTSSGTSGNISSISMVPGTYNDPTSSNSNGATKATQEDTADNDDVMMDEPSYMPQETGTHSPAPRASAKNRHFVQLPSSPVSGRSPLPPSDSIPANSSTNSKSTPSIEHTVKRKSDTSPSNINPRQTKRREIKVHKFSGLSQLSQDPVAAYRQEKKASMEKFRAERLNTTESPNLAGYNNGDSDVSQDSFAKRQVSVHSPQKMELDHEPRTPQTPQNATQRPQVLLADAASPSTPSSTANIFGKFRQAYPDYKGDVTHFANQCKQIYTLEQGDKMVPKWMWDDFLIRNRTDFKDYALRCMDAGEDPGPYIRYYKDHIQKTIYEKGILKDVATLAKALGELGYDLPLSTGPATARNQGLPRRSLIGTTNSPLSTPGWRQRSIRPGLSQGRQSLPDRSQDQNHVSGGHTNRDPLKQSGWKAPRHSYPETTNPVKAKTNPRAPQKTINPMSGHTNGLGQAIEMTGDAFRDFVLAQKKMTAVTGSTKVGRNMKWPQYLAIRPSLPPRKAPDVLSWKDDL